MEGLEIQVKTDNGIPVVRAKGIVIFNDMVELDKAVRSLVEESSRLVLDLREVEFMDSGGLQVVAYAIRRLSGDGKFFGVLVKPDSQPEAVLQVTGFDSIIKVSSDPADVGLGGNHEPTL